MATELAAGLYHVDCTTRDRPNVYVVDDGEVTLVDAGWPGDEATVRAGLDAAGFAPGDVDRVLLTHYDADHVGTLARLTPELDAPVYVHRREAPYVAGERRPPWTARHGLEALHRLYYRRMTLPDLPVRPVEDGDAVGEFRAVHRPGHTPGHLAWVHEGLDAVFIGDIVHAVGEGLRPAGWLTSYDASRVPDGIRALLDRAPGFAHACPGHGPTLAEGHERLAAAID